MAHLLDMIPTNFFSVLASPNRKTYIDCIFIIYHASDSIEDAFQGEREFIISKLVDYFDEEQDDLIPDDLDEEVARTSRQKAVYVINTLKNYGWIGEEELGNYKTSLNLFDYSIHIIDVLERIKNNQQTEYTGEIYTVYSLLSSFDVDEGIGVLEQAHQKTNDILRKLKALKANIYRYYYDITRNKSDQNLQHLLEKLLIEYKQNFFDSAYYNLKTTDSLSRYKRQILSQISRILNDEVMMDNLAERVMKIKHVEDYNEAYHMIENKLLYISESFMALEYLIQAIDRKNEQYISAAASKIMFFTNQSDDIEGIFNRLFKIVLDQKGFDYTALFNLVQIRNIDTQSLYNQRRLRLETVPEEILFDPDTITDEYRQEKIRMLLKNNIYGKKEIDQYVKGLIKEHDMINACDIPLDTQEDFVRLILIFLYSKSTGMHYDIEMTKKVCQTSQITFQNFKIKGVKR